MTTSDINLQLTLTNVRRDLAHLIPYSVTLEQITDIIKYIKSAMILPHINLRKSDIYFLSCHRNSTCKPYFTIREVEQQIGQSFLHYPYKNYLTNGYYLYVIGLTYNYEYVEMLVPEKIFEEMINIIIT
jgi:hypothetical protein